jgi:hypothetical protein
LATSEISAKAWKTLQNPCKTPSYWWVVCKCVPVRVLHFADNQYESVVWTNLQDLKNTRRTQFLFLLKAAVQ